MSGSNPLTLQARCLTFSGFALMRGFLVTRAQSYGASAPPLSPALPRGTAAFANRRNRGES